MKNILIVGAGAVGQVYGYKFAQAGHNVSFLIKEKYRDDLKQGLTLYSLNNDKKKQRPINFTHFNTLTSWDEAKQKAAETAWDQVYLCISSTALANFDFAGLKSALSDESTLVMLQPGPKDYALAAQHIDESQIVQGMITLISYATPLPTEKVPTPGIAYWLPPITATPFAGKPDKRAAIIKTFKKSGMDATSKQDLRTTAPYPTAALMAFLTALEACHWSFDSLKADRALQNEMIAALKQATKAISLDNQSTEPLWRFLITPTLIRIALRVAPSAIPLDLETYFQVHFTKVKDQTKLFMQTYIESAKQHGLNATELMALNQLTN